MSDDHHPHPHHHHHHHHHHLHPHHHHHHRHRRKKPKEEQAGYVDELQNRGWWPPSKGQALNEDAPTATPFLVVPFSSGDTGDRPVGDPQDIGFISVAVGVFDSSGKLVTDRPVAGTTYTLRCAVRNLGTAPSYGGLAEFYVASFDDAFAAATSGEGLPAHGYTGFTIPPGATVNVVCPNTWTPANFAEAGSSVLVQVYDPFIDRLERPFDARNDRHVGLRAPGAFAAGPS